MMKIINKIFSAFETRLVPPRLSLWRTLYFNFRVLPFREALMFPFYIYGKVHFPLLAGKVEIHSVKKRGMIKIGQQDPFACATGQGFIAIAPDAKIIFNGPGLIRANVCIRVLHGILLIGKYSKLCSTVQVICNGGSVSIGDYVDITFKSVLINSSFHTIIDLNSMTANSHIKDIFIGNKSWIGTGSVIAGGSRLKDGTIVAAGSYVNKDFTQSELNNQMIAGRPAKIVRTDVARVWSPILESQIIEWFNTHLEQYILTSIKEDEIKDLHNTKEFN